MILSPQLKKSYEDNGYWIFDVPISPETIDAIIRDVGPLYTDGEQDRSGRFGIPHRNGKRIQDAWKVSPSVKELALHPDVLELLRELYGREPRPFQTLNFCVGTEQSAHQDSAHFSSIPSGFMCGVWIALEDIDLRNGPLAYYPGTHKWPDVTREDFPSAGDMETTYLNYEKHIAGLINRMGVVPQYGVVRKGQAILWAANLLHGGAPQIGKSRSRHSVVVHYFFEGCKYCTPLLSVGNKIHWRNPDWIT